jgi:hypothetical protein
MNKSREVDALDRPASLDPPHLFWTSCTPLQFIKRNFYKGILKRAHFSMPNFCSFSFSNQFKNSFSIQVQALQENCSAFALMISSFGIAQRVAIYFDYKIT